MAMHVRISSLSWLSLPAWLVLLPTFAILSQTQLVIEVAQASRGDLFARRHYPFRCWPTLDLVNA
jgi:hypothetical protein